MSGLEALGAISSCIAIVEASIKVTQFLKDVAKADSDRDEFITRLERVVEIAERVESRVRSQKDDLGRQRFAALDPKNSQSPLQKLRTLLQDMQKILVKGRGTNIASGKIHKIRLKDFKWPGEKKSLEDLRKTLDGYTSEIEVFMIDAVYDISDDTNIVLKTQEFEAERRSIIRWLSPLDFSARQQHWYETFGKIGTGDRFLKSEPFKYWKEKKVKYLRCYGDAGAGKTILSCIVVEKLRQECIANSPPVPVLCIYLEKTPSTEHTPRTLCGSLLKQLVQFKKSSVSIEIQTAYRGTEGLLAPKDDDLKRLLKVEIEQYSRVYIVVDGMDEASADSRRFIKHHLRYLSPEKISLLTLGREDEEADIKGRFCDYCDKRCVVRFSCQECLQQASPIKFDLCPECFEKNGLCPDTPSHRLKYTSPENFQLTVETPDEELEYIVKSLIQEEMPNDHVDGDYASPDHDSSTLGKICKNDAVLFQQIVNAIVQNSDRRLLLATRYLRIFQIKGNLRETRKRLKQLENRQIEDEDKVYHLYEKELEDRIMGQDRTDRDLALRILALIHYAKRKLKFRELQQALATEPGDIEYDEEGNQTEGNVLSVTQGMVIIANGTVQFNHLTLSEYFEKHADRWFKTSKGESLKHDLAGICLSFLRFDAFSKPCKREEFLNKEKKLPFISYAVQYWGDHVRDAGPQSLDVVDAAVGYLQNSSRIEAYIQAAWMVDKQAGDKWDVRRNVHPLHICAWFDLGHLIEKLDKRLENLDVTEKTYGQTPLMYACRRGNVQFARKLLDLGASINASSDKGRNPLLEAILRLKKRDNSLLDLHESLEIVRLLLNHRIQGRSLSINEPNPKLFNRTPLILSIMRGYEDIALAILRRPDVLVNWQDADGFNALIFAVLAGQDNVVEAILEKEEVQVDLLDTSGGRSALIFAAMKNHWEIFALLWDKGANLKLKDLKGGTALLRAVEAGSAVLIYRFLTMTYQPEVLDCIDEDDRGLIHWAAETGQVDILQRLLDEIGNRNLNATDKFGMTPLHLACISGKLGTAELLVQKGADFAIKDLNGRTAFTVACQHGHADLIKLCKAQGTNSEADSNQTYISQLLPIWSLATLGRLDLIETKSQISDVREPGIESTALHCALIKNANEVNSVHQKRLAAQTSQATHEMQVIAAVAESALPAKQRMQVQIMEVLLRKGDISASATDKHLRTPLHLAVLYGNTEAVKLLLEHTPVTTINSPDRFDHTPLRIAFQNNYLYIAILLIAAGATLEDAKVDLDLLLFASIEMGNAKVYSELIMAGADPLAQDEENRTAEQLAKGNGELSEELRNLMNKTPSWLHQDLPMRGTGSVGLQGRAFQSRSNFVFN